MVLRSADIREIAKQVAVELHKMQDEVMTITEVARLFDTTEKAIRTKCYRKQLPFNRKEGKYFFSKNEMTKILLLASNSNQ